MDASGFSQAKQDQTRRLSNSVLRRTLVNVVVFAVVYLALFLGFPLALADTAGHEVARFPKAWHNGLPLAAALLTVNEAVCRVYVLVPGQFHTGGCLVDQRPDFCGNLHHTVSSSFTL